MPVATYDNPDTMDREAWQDGRLVAKVSARLLLSKDFRGDRSMFFGLNAGDWNPGQLLGSREAIPTSALGVGSGQDKASA